MEYLIGLCIALVYLLWRERRDHARTKRALLNAAANAAQVMEEMMEMKRL